MLADMDGEAVRVLRVFPDHTADPVWAVDGMVDLDGLGISESLRTDLRTWAREWEVLVVCARAGSGSSTTPLTGVGSPEGGS